LLIDKFVLSLWCNIARIKKLLKMANYKKEYWNKSKTKCVMITRSKLSDGYNYYLTVLRKGGLHNSYVIDESIKQKESILSEAEAIKQAKRLINVV
jgi:hypothetical protein